LTALTKEGAKRRSAARALRAKQLPGELATPHSTQPFAPHFLSKVYSQTIEVVAIATIVQVCGTVADVPARLRKGHTAQSQAGRQHTWEAQLP